MMNAKPHIALAITLGEIGGAQRFVLGFAKWLKQRDYLVTVVTGDGTWLEEMCQHEGIEVVKLKHFGRSISPRDLLAFWELIRVFGRLKPDAIHLNSTKMGALGSLAARLVLTPRVVYRIGGWVFLEPLSQTTKNLYRRIERWGAKWKDVIICVHPGDEDVAKKEGITPRKQIVTIPNGINIATFDQQLIDREQARKELRIPTGAPVFGTVAGFYPPKNLPHYLDACAIVHRQIPKARFVLLGDGPERKRIVERCYDLKLADVVVLAGTMNGHASRYLRAFDCFVLPSVKEGMPWSLLEAMAASLPCIVTDVGANAWMVGQEAGWIVPANDTAKLAQAMINTLTHQDEAKRRGTIAREEVMNRFPLEKTYERNREALLPS